MLARKPQQRRLLEREIYLGYCDMKLLFRLATVVIHHQRFYWHKHLGTLNGA
jgi:hypothetical protein